MIKTIFFYIISNCLANNITEIIWDRSLAPMNGSIFSEGWLTNELYSNNLNCTWILSAPPGVQITLQIIEISLERDGFGSCGFDFVTIQLDRGNANADFLGEPQRICEMDSNDGDSLISTLSGQIEINFVTDSGNDISANNLVPFSGFQIDWVMDFAEDVEVPPQVVVFFGPGEVETTTTREILDTTSLENDDNLVQSENSKNLPLGIYIAIGVAVFLFILISTAAALLIFKYNSFSANFQVQTLTEINKNRPVRVESFVKKNVDEVVQPETESENISQNEENESGKYVLPEVRVREL